MNKFEKKNIYFALRPKTYCYLTFDGKVIKKRKEYKTLIESEMKPED